MCPMSSTLPAAPSLRSSIERAWPTGRPKCRPSHSHDHGGLPGRLWRAAALMFGALLNRVPDPFTLMGVFHFLYTVMIALSAVCGILGLMAGLALLAKQRSGRTRPHCRIFVALQYSPGHNSGSLHARNVASNKSYAALRSLRTNRLARFPRGHNALRADEARGNSKNRTEVLPLVMIPVGRSTTRRPELSGCTNSEPRSPPIVSGRGSICVQFSIGSVT
jgi:hypothetical protein